MPADSTHDDDVARGLEECLRRIARRGDLRLAGRLQRLAGGFDTGTFAFELDGAPPELSGRLVLRLFRTPAHVNRARVEAAVHRAAAAGGHRVPNVPVDCDGYLILGRPFFVMERAPGTSLGEAMADPAVAAAMPRMLADIHAGLHSMPSSRLVRALTQAGADISRLTPFRLLDDIHRWVEVPALKDLRPVAGWLDRHRPEPPANPSICHGDLHEWNVMVVGPEVTAIIDWANVALGHPEFDVAFTGFALSIGPIEGGEADDPRMRERTDRAVEEYVAAYRERRPLDDALVAYYTVLRAAHALARVALAHAGRELPGAAPDGYAWAHPVLLKAIAGAVHAGTGIPVALPDPA
ncbi:MAG: phosphotransferase [Gemmatimonadetes bacterium]|nr:phosphotransferase [Gemmatimonadota bacterium]